MFAFGVNYEKPTIIMYTPDLARHLKDLENLRCEAKPTGISDGREVDGIWNSAADVAYPAELNLWIAQAIAQLATTHRDIGPHPLVSKLIEGLYNILHETSSNNSSNPTPVPPLVTDYATPSLSTCCRTTCACRLRDSSSSLSMSCSDPSESPESTE